MAAERQRPGRGLALTGPAGRAGSGPTRLGPWSGGRGALPREPRADHGLPHPAAVQEERQRGKDRNENEVESTSSANEDMPVEKILEAELAVEPKTETYVDANMGLNPNSVSATPPHRDRWPLVSVVGERPHLSWAVLTPGTPHVLSCPTGPAARAQLGVGGPVCAPMWGQGWAQSLWPRGGTGLSPSVLRLARRGFHRARHALFVHPCTSRALARAALSDSSSRVCLGSGVSLPGALAPCGLPPRPCEGGPGPRAWLRAPVTAPGTRQPVAGCVVG